MHWEGVGALEWGGVHWDGVRVHWDGVNVQWDGVRVHWDAFCVVATGFVWK